MSAVVYKVELPFAPDSPIRLDLPTEAKVLTVQLQREKLQLWYLCDPEEKQTQPRDFIQVETGYQLPIGTECFKFINTLLIDGGNYVLHIFELI